MNIWDAFGVSPKAALLAAAAGLVAAVVLALTTFRRARGSGEDGLRLHDD